ncbi:MAG: HNH endonuclease signature motif containing protein [Candidatus Nitrosocosmicus sp.]|nr:HNH endonuclease signature motif containing protein [Candidatus Nitrosocosmicus sp.]
MSLENVIVLKKSNSFVLGYCRCGCSNRIKIRTGGYLRKYVIGHQALGEKNANWNNGTTINDSGYVMTLRPDHPNVQRNRYVREHRNVMEKHVGRYLKKSEVVHHKNGNKQDNRIENLQVLNNAYHVSLHMKGKRYRLNHFKDMSDRVCFSCGTDKTYVKPVNIKHNEKSYINWFHLPWDKVNWYCRKCYRKLCSKN